VALVNSEWALSLPSQAWLPDPPSKTNKKKKKEKWVRSASVSLRCCCSLNSDCKPIPCAGSLYGMSRNFRLLFAESERKHTLALVCFAPKLLHRCTLLASGDVARRVPKPTRPPRLPCQLYSRNGAPAYFSLLTFRFLDINENAWPTSCRARRAVVVRPYRPSRALVPPLLVALRLPSCFTGPSLSVRAPFSLPSIAHPRPSCAGPDCPPASLSRYPLLHVDISY